MSKGMEMLVNTLFKSMDIDKDEVIGQFTGAQKLLVESVKNFDARLRAIENTQQEILSLLTAHVSQKVIENAQSLHEDIKNG